MMTEYTPRQIELARELERKSRANIERFKAQRAAEAEAATAGSAPARPTSTRPESTASAR
jgi:hypothetical protein